jgi:hypothetical protein
MAPDDVGELVAGEWPPFECQRDQRDAALVAGQVGVAEPSGRAVEADTAGEVETCQTFSKILPMSGS